MKKISLIISIVFVFLFFFGCSSQCNSNDLVIQTQVHSEESVEASQTSEILETQPSVKASESIAPPSELLDLGGNVFDFAIQDNWLYAYVEPFKCYNLDSGENYEVTSDIAVNVGVYGDWIYYTTVDGSKSYLRKIQKDGTNKQTIAENIQLLKQYGTYILFVYMDKEGLYCYSIERDAIIQLYDGLTMLGAC